MTLYSEFLKWNYDGTHKEEDSGTTEFYCAGGKTMNIVGKPDGTLYITVSDVDFFRQWAFNDINDFEHVIDIVIEYLAEVEKW